MKYIEKIVLMHKGKILVINKLHEGRLVELSLPLLLTREDYISKDNVIYMSNQTLS